MLNNFISNDQEDLIMAVQRKLSLEEEMEKFGVTKQWQLDYAKAIHALDSVIGEAYACEDELSEQIWKHHYRGLIEELHQDFEEIDGLFSEVLDEEPRNSREVMEREGTFEKINSGYYDYYLGNLEIDYEDDDLNEISESIAYGIRSALSKLLTAHGLQ